MINFSIITAVYNNPDHLEECIRSVRSQTYPHIEHIIVDGASTDNTPDIIKSNQHPGMRWISEPDQGIYDALNKGIGLAKGEVIGLLHSDDVFFSVDTIQKLADCFEEYQADAVYGDLRYVARDDIQKVIRYWKSEPFQKRLLRKGWMPPHPTLFVKKSLFDELGNYRNDFRIAADYDFILRLFKKENLNPVYLPEVIVKMRWGGASNRNIKNIFLKSQEDYRALKDNQVGGFGTLFMKNFQKLSQFRHSPQK